LAAYFKYFCWCFAIEKLWTLFLLEA